MSFKDIKGQDRAISFLKGMLENNRYSHAYIFLGPSGVGRKKTALNFAKALNCSALPQERPCDKCVSCRKIDASNHPDIRSLSPDAKSASIKIERIRELIKDIGFKPYEGRVKVFHIDDAGAMTQEASNALLKTLEEPPQGSILILTVEDLGALPQTIVSRSQVVRFFPLKADEIEDILIKEYDLDDARAHILSHLSSGSIGRALRFEDEGLFDKRVDIIDGLSNGTFFDSDFEGASREDLKSDLDIALTWYRDILAKKIGLEDSVLVNIDRIDVITNEAKRLDFDYLDRVISQIILTNFYLDQNANPKLAMGVLGLKVISNP